MDEDAARHVGKTLHDETIAAHANDMFWADRLVRGTLLSPGYREQMVRVSTSRALREIRGDTIPEQQPIAAA